MKTILAAILFAFLQTTAVAQVVYSVTDVLDEKKSRLELWILNVPEDEEIDHELIKEPFNKESTPFEKQVQRAWFKEIHQAGQPTYFRERLTRHPANMRNGQTSYGYIEERDVTTHRVINSFPVFYAAAGMNLWKRVTFKIYLSNGVEEVVIKDFYKSLYHFPFLESRIVSQYGVVQSHLIYKQEK